MSEFKYKAYSIEEKFQFYKRKSLSLTYMLEQVTQYLESKGLLDDFNQHALNQAEQSSSMEQRGARGPIDYDDIPVIGD